MKHQTQFSPLFSENPLKHSRLKSHLCASTGICSLLLLITHSDCYALRVPAICLLLFAYRATSSPFMLIIYNFTSDCYTLRVPAICPYYSHIARLRHPFMLIIYNSPQIATRFAFPQSVLIIRISRNFIALYAHNKAPPKLPRHPLCKHRCIFLCYYL